MNYYLAVLKKYAVFSGRAQRKEYWMFTLINAIIIVLATLIVYSFSGAVQFFLYCLLVIYYLAIFLPSLAVFVRRLHDTDRSGWWFFIGVIPFIGSIVLFIFMVLDSTPGENKYGPNPKGVGASKPPESIPTGL